MAILKDAPEGARVLELDVARIARAEAREGKTFVKLSAGFVEVKPEVPLESAFAFQEERLRDGLALLVVDPDDVDALLKDGLSAQDLAEIVQFIGGKSLGESRA